MRFGGRYGMGGAEQLLRLRRTRRKRNRRRAIKRRLNEAENVALATELAMLGQENKLSCSESPCSVVTLSLSLNDRSAHLHDGEWIRRTVVSDISLMEQDRRSPLFTGRMLNREDLMGDGRLYLRPASSQGRLTVDNSHVRNREISRLSLRQRLGPPEAHSFRRYIDVTVSPERLPYPENQQLDAPSWRQLKDNRPYNQGFGLMNDGFNPNRNDEYDPEGFTRDHFSSPSQRSYGFRRSPYYPTDYSTSNHDAVRERRSRMPWMEASVNHHEYPPDTIDHNERLNRDYSRNEEFNPGRFARDSFTPPPQMHRGNYRHSLCYPPDYSSPRQDTPREPRPKVPWMDPQMNYPEYPPDYCEMPYYNERQNSWYDGPFSQADTYDAELPPQRSGNFRQSLYFPPGSSSPLRNGTMNPERLRLWGEPPVKHWKGPSGPSVNQCFYENSFSDEDFTDSDQSDSETEDAPENKSKKLVKKMWKTVMKERGVLVAHDGTYSSMTKEHADYVKKVLMEKAMDPGTVYQGDWRPRFIRTGLVHRSGLYQIICKDHPTLVWLLKQEIPPLDGHKFKILKRPYSWDCGPVRINIWLPAEPLDPATTLLGLEAENPGIGAPDWKNVSVGLDDGWRQMVADISSESALYLEANDWSVLYWNKILPVTRMEKVSRRLFDGEDVH